MEKENTPDKQRFKELKSKHNSLLRKWKKAKNLCIICGEKESNEKDHLPPKVLFPEVLRNSKTEFFTYPVCTQCNRASSDADFLLSTLVSWSVNQSSYKNNTDPIKIDSLSLHDQSLNQLVNSKEAKRRRRLLKKYTEFRPNYTTSNNVFGVRHQAGIRIDKVPVNNTLVKIVKSIYWLQTDGDILENYNPGWWIFPNVNTSTPTFIDNHLKTTHAEIHWNNRFITHYTVGEASNDVGGLISCSLHFYSEGKTGKGLSWFVVAMPTKTYIKGESLFAISQREFGKPTIKPKK